MTKTTDMWIIEHGEYSDYQVVAVCPDEVTARAVCERMNSLDGPGIRPHAHPYECSRRPVVTTLPTRVRCWVSRDCDGCVRDEDFWSFDAPEDGEYVFSIGWEGTRYRSESVARKASHDAAARKAAVIAGQAMP